MGRIPESESEKWYNLGATYGDSGKYEKAIECFDKVIELEPNNASAWTNKGTLLSLSRKYQEAIKCYDKAIELEPDNAITWFNKGSRALQFLDKYEESIKCFDKVIELEPDNASAWTSKAVMFEYLDKYEESIKCYDKAIELEPDNAITWFNKGSTLMGESQMDVLHLTDSGYFMTDWEEANKCYDQALKLDPTNMLAWLDKGTCTKRLGKDNESAKCYDEGAELLWHRIVENVGKIMKTKTGVVFSYRIKGDKIIPQYHLKLTHSNPDLAGKKYGEGIPIKKSQVREAFVRVPIKGPTQIKDIIFRPEHLWAILHDPRISDGNW